EEPLVVPAEVTGEDLGRAIDVAQDRAVVEQHTARQPAGPAGVDDARRVAAADFGDARIDRRTRGCRVSLDQLAPQVRGEAGLPRLERLDADDVLGQPRAQYRREQRLRQLAG